MFNELLSIELWSFKLATVVSDVVSLDAGRPICEGCENRQGLFVSRDYTFCSQCDQVLCAVCALREHRGHKLKSRQQRLHDVEKVEEYMQATAKKLATVEKEFEQLLSQTAHGRADAPIESLQNLKQKAFQCRQQFDFMQQRKRALARGWDRTSQEFLSNFDRCLGEFRQLKGDVERVMLSVGTMSSEEPELTSESE